MKKVLIVDNNVEILSAMKRILLLYGYEVMSVTTYQMIDINIKYQKPDVIIMDVMLDNQDGRIACKQLKKNTLTKDIFILLMSGSPEKLIDFKKYKADGILEKPFDIEKLLNVIERRDKFPHVI